jgi:hypothetical protein
MVEKLSEIGSKIVERILPDWRIAFSVTRNIVG